ncbi:hypothetical protein A2W24_05380 [Microgenomates group bacterium RBG_16_45_19]|nr:MAG: hypothetical protein A2W24_05380 [Microgenomates group bacterium RBG_16_45_19]
MKEKIIPVLVILLIGSAFAVGLLYGKVSVYEKGGKQVLGQEAAGNNNQAQVPPAAPTEGPLTEAQWNKVLSEAKMVRGQDGAKVTVVEFTDYQCPFCERYFTETYGQLAKQYVDNGQVRYILRDLPLPFHPNAKPAALAARCAGEQDGYWEMHDLLFAKQDEWIDGDPKEKFVSYAGEAGLNTGQFTTCYEGGKYNSEIEADAALAAEVGASGTPTFFINREVVVGAQPTSVFQQAIDKALEG